MKKLGVSEEEVAERMGITVSELRSKTTEDKKHLVNDLYGQAKKLKDEGLTIIEISKRMKLSESNVKNILNKPSL